MNIIDFNQGELLSRKEYLKKKKREKRKSKFSKITKRTWFMFSFILLVATYVIIQFYVYNTKHRLVETLPEEISSMKDYKIYYVSQTYTYDSKNELKSMSTTSNEKKTIKEGSGIYQINIVDNNIYGIKDGSLVRINTNLKEDNLEILVENNVKGYAIYKNEIYVHLSGEGIETGVYSLTQKNKLKNVIKGDIYQLIIDNNNIYVVNKDKNIICYDKKEYKETCIVNDSSAGSLIQDNKNIYFVNVKDSNKIYKIEKDTSEITPISKTGITFGGYNGMNGYSSMGVYNNEIYYINTNDSNKLYKSSTNLEQDESVLKDNIQILHVINGTIFYKINGDIGVYRYDIENKVSSQVTSARVLEFKAEAPL